MRLSLVRTPDIAASLGERKKNGQLLVGFALETENELEHAKDKLERKNMDLIVLNSLKNPGAGFGHDTNQITIIDKNAEKSAFPLKSKSQVAADILDAIANFSE
jgi:phosphopantothenoylcysteine decarboxylase/phosphopantothenate--cysteine ligase